MSTPTAAAQVIAELKMANSDLKQENNLLRQFATRVGFFQYYFTQLEFYKTKKECFDAVNEKYFELLGEYRYESYTSFRVCINIDTKKK
jgi:hypothetical protein